ncbi:Oligosaccharide biosynthesis protein Alg14 like protein [Anaerohalosphaera lusitana]|uniref:Oligosaccharide biosynthesis protein Alg14 like protein n=1 Tax=Anaerohalosphaera lusitana TaxID=1936003 RepID=A0A1U9NNJ1_9BACT|nr:UDP-N-acetylglucosamine--LPS N-acetylglucosamine transferase [Anaerohalosphaera lusitana]AQT69459.1 Oligosaccharide biosynthesis protein Alg14 like protein [Anaerohalosphaera lusitana]
MSQLLILLNCWDFQQKPDLYVTTRKQTAQPLESRGPTYCIGECNRRKPVRSLLVLLKTLSLALRKRPDVIITTGSMPLALFCGWSKLLGAKIVWIDSITNIEKLSVSGRFVRHFADLMLVQWPELTNRYTKAEYVGAIV